MTGGEHEPCADPGGLLYRQKVILIAIYRFNVFKSAAYMTGGEHEPCADPGGLLYRQKVILIAIYRFNVFKSAAYLTGGEHEPCADPGGVPLYRMSERQARTRHVRGLPLHHRQHVSSHQKGYQPPLPTPLPGGRDRANDMIVILRWKSQRYC
jgi:hypothetical protein